MSRPLYGHEELHRLLAPRTITIVGASSNAGSFGSRTLSNLVRYTGEIRLVNPKYDKIGDRPCYPSLAALPEPPDCVVVALPREAVEATLCQAADARAGGVIVFASGYAETGKSDRIAQQSRLTSIAREARLPVLGPNCLGIINQLLNAGILFQAYEHFARPPGRVGIVSQSGALAYTLVQGCQHGFGYTHMLSAGNSCDVDVLDLANYLLAQPECSAVACMLEGLNDGGRLLELGERARAAEKPVVVYKMATAQGGASAAKSHTGTMAGSAEAYAAAFRRAGFVAVEDLAEVSETAEFFSKAGPPQAPGIAVIATSGGAAVMAADQAHAFGLAMPQPGPEARAVLESRIPDFGSARNPCDLTAQVLNDPQSFVTCAESLLGDPAFGVLLLPQITAHKDITEKRAPIVSAVAERMKKPICIVWLAEWLEGPGAALFAQDPRITVFRSMRRCLRTLAYWHSWYADLKQGNASGARLTGASEMEEARAALSVPERTLGERLAKRVVAACGIHVVRDIAVKEAEAAVGAAEELGYPVVLKLDSPDVAHKTEIDAVRPKLANAHAVRQACAEIVAAAREKAPGARLNGFLVQPMVNGNLEMVFGARRDLQFGALVMVGLGGVMVELLRDVVTELAPVTPATARHMLERLKCYPLLKGFRGKPGCDIEALALALARFSELAAAFSEEIEEMDVNPLICTPEGVVAVDALIIKRDRN